MTEIPNAFGGFAPFPNTIMIPTMGLQSAVIGYRFGFGYEKGKRTLRAMSNEQFNTLDEEAEQAIFKRHDSEAINYFKVEMHNWVELQNLIIEKSVEIEVMKANRTPSAFREMFEGFTKGFSEQQKQDAGNFFAGLKDTIMQLMSWFSTGSKSTVVQPRSPIQPIVPTGPVPPLPPTPEVGKFIPETNLPDIIGSPTLAKTFQNSRTRFGYWQNLVTIGWQARANRRNFRVTNQSAVKTKLAGQFTILMRTFAQLTNLLLKNNASVVKPHIDKTLKWIYAG